MNKKIGKFKLWHLIALGAAVGMAVYLYRRNTTGGGVNPEEVVGGTGTGAFGPINPNTGIPYAFEDNGSSGNSGLNDAFDLIERAKELGGGSEAGGGETYTETIVQEPGEPTPLVQTKNHKPKRTGEAAANKHSHKAPKHPKQRIGIGPGKSLGKGRKIPKPARQRKPKQQKPKQRQRQSKPKQRRKARR